MCYRPTLDGIKYYSRGVDLKSLANSDSDEESKGSEGRLHCGRELGRDGRRQRRRVKGELREKRNVGRDGFITVVASERQIRTVIDQSEEEP